MILRARGASSLRQRSDVADLGSAGGIPQHAHEAVQRNDQVGDAHRLDDDQDDRAVDVVAGGIFPMRLVAAYMEVGHAAVAVAQGERQRQIEGAAQARQ